MHNSATSLPTPGLASFVRFYVQRTIVNTGPAIVHPVPARATSMIEFGFGDAMKVRYAGTAALVKSPNAVVVGAQTRRRVEMHLRGSLESFVIMFQPSGLHRLFSIPANELTDQDYDAHTVLGGFIEEARQRLGDCQTFLERVRVIESLLMRQSLLTRNLGGVSLVAHAMMLAAGRVNLPKLAGATGFGMRQFERHFINEVGMRPKLFARISRYEAALDHKARFPTTTWTDVAHRFGYYDQMHMIHDFTDLSGETPTKMLREIENVLAEQIRDVRSGRGLTMAESDPRLIL